MTITHETRVRLWDAINRYVQTCGGDPSKHVYGNTARQRAVAEVEQVLRGDAPAEPERTPEVVLRAMLAAYQAAALEEEVTFLRASMGGDVVRLRSEHTPRKGYAAGYVRDALASFLVGGNHLAILATWGLTPDYEKRLSGARPLNAPPMEAP